MAEQHYKVNCSKKDDGTYELSYGKGKKKLTERVERYGGGTQKFFIPGGLPCTSEEDGTPGPHLIDTLGKLKTAWGVWAKAQYNKGGFDSGEPASPPQPTADTKALLIEEDEPMPVVGTSGELIAEKNGFEIRTHTPNKRFPYTDGYAFIETASHRQYGWMKDRGRALLALDEVFQGEGNESDHQRNPAA